MDYHLKKPHQQESGWQLHQLTDFWKNKIIAMRMKSLQPDFWWRYRDLIHQE